MQGPSATISTNIVSPVAKTIAGAVHARWFLVLIGALAIAFIATLIAATLVANSTLTPSVAIQLRTGLGAALLDRADVLSDRQPDQDRRNGRRARSRGNARSSQCKSALRCMTVMTG